MPDHATFLPDRTAGRPPLTLLLANPRGFCPGGKQVSAAEVHGRQELTAFRPSKVA